MTHDHTHGLVLAGVSAGTASAIAYAANWFTTHIQQIDGFMYFGVLAISGITGLIGLRKVLRSKGGEGKP